MISNRESGELSVKVKGDPDIIIYAYDPSSGELEDIELKNFYTSDLCWRPFKSTFLKNENLSIACWAGEDVPFALNVFWEVKGFGEIFLIADHGEGFRKTNSTININLNYELAGTKVRKLLESYETYVKDGYNFSKEVIDSVREVETIFNRSTDAENPFEKARYADQALNMSLWIGEKLELEKARTDINKYRMVNLTLQFLDEEGQPLSNANISLQQVDTPFLFGANAFGALETPEYDEHFEELFNFATLPFYRIRTEPLEGSYDWDRVDEILGWLKDKGIKAKGHPLIWLKKKNNPPWFNLKENFNEVKTESLRYVKDAIKRYKGEICIWDIINEAHDPTANDWSFTRPQLLDLTKSAVEAAKSLDPYLKIIVNCMRPWGEYMATSTHAYWTPWKFLQELNSLGVDYDAVGLQLYYNFIKRDLTEVSRLLDFYYAKIGKPIHITELGTPSDWNAKNPKEKWRVVKNWGYWHKPWDEEVQADWLEQFYTICFSKPYVEAITCWNLADPAFIPSGGLLREDMAPKKSFERLKALIGSWTRNNLQGTTDSEGILKLRIFKGTYTVKATAQDGRIFETTVNTGTEPTQKITIKIG